MRVCYRRTCATSSRVYSLCSFVDISSWHRDRHPNAPTFHMFTRAKYLVARKILNFRRPNINTHHFATTVMPMTTKYSFQAIILHLKLMKRSSTDSVHYLPHFVTKLMPLLPSVRKSSVHTVRNRRRHHHLAVIYASITSRAIIGWTCRGSLLERIPCGREKQHKRLCFGAMHTILKPLSKS